MNHANLDKNKAEGAILIPEKINYEAKKQTHYIMIKIFTPPKIPAKPKRTEKRN